MLVSGLGLNLSLNLGLNLGLGLDLNLGLSLNLGVGLNLGFGIRSCKMTALHQNCVFPRCWLPLAKTTNNPHFFTFLYLHSAQVH